MHDLWTNAVLRMQMVKNSAGEKVLGRSLPLPHVAERLASQFAAVFGRDVTPPVQPLPSRWPVSPSARQPVK